VPRPVQTGRRYVPGLDGIRAVAVLCVIAYHLNVPWARGGMLGVGVFFTLSGYLITDLLLGHWYRHANLGLKTFWIHRARRLLPALFLMLIVVSLWVAIFDTSQLADVRRQVIASALYFANWSTIAAHGSYFSRFAAPLPLDHVWSLAIEEQFYLVWPWLLGIAILLVRSRVGLALLTLAGAAGSAYLMSHLYHPGFDPTRVYEGTDTRAFGLLVGAALAIVWPTGVPRRGARWAIRHPVGLDLMGVAGLVGILILVWRTDAFDPFTYPTGFILLSVATVALLFAVVNPSSLLGPILGCAPLRWIGVRSYGIYLWQWPIVVLWGAPRVGVNWPQAGLQVAVTFVLAALSWRLVEEPIRHGALGRLWRRARSGVTDFGARRRTFALSATTVCAVSVAAVGLTGVLPAASVGHNAAQNLSSLPPKLLTSLSTSNPTGNGRTNVPIRPPTHTSCRSVVYIGDSTSEGEISTNYIPKARRRLPEQLARVGVKTVHPEISGARSIVETYEGNPNAATVARRYISEGFHGCWILALGTNDVANVQVGSRVGLSARIARMMSIIGHRPVLWVGVITLVSPGRPYAEDQMQKWNDDLVSACPQHPTMRVFDWAADAKQKYFIPDGIHYYSPGYVARTHAIARALVKAFPAHRPASAICLVS
jgi:peptidoglycan/LPS O-acetylase OafA/YrhL